MIGVKNSKVTTQMSSAAEARRVRGREEAMCVSRSDHNVGMVRRRA